MASESPFRPEETEAQTESNGLPLATKILGARWPGRGMLANVRKGAGD